MQGTVLESIDQTVMARLGRFRQKVIRLCIYENKSIYETAIACGCSADKVKRVIKKWKMIRREEQRKALAAQNTQLEESRIPSTSLS
ncbi:sigma-70 family RNA polymerase sigma factor [Brevibacillus fulvus]|uniref:DNA-directed RNA polymerase specialized sigma24 family protein n=1 Tax=Brevibacillus fulvus TaxID=1125967 RepID=A0A938Y1G0_9BACL|nr:sigma-70 family RNA polymerase sigma factor [Brevibacillus fulvus]MBM7589857.1 DNA-directed RNA polymerase specialized sigma24 family protein [Brevibacillus fulvus]